jgi:hypothetical protein
MKTWRGWAHVVLLGAATVAAAYMFGSAPVSAVPACIGCDCKNIYVWKVDVDNYGQGLVDATNTPVQFGYTGICTDICPNTPFINYSTVQLNRRKYTQPFEVCDNSVGGGSTCHGTVVEATGSLDTTVLGQTTWGICQVNPPPPPPGG